MSVIDFLGLPWWGQVICVVVFVAIFFAGGYTYANGWPGSGRCRGNRNGY